MEDNEQGPCHCTEGQETLGEVADALFDDMIDDAGCFAFVCFVFVGFLAGDAEGVGMEGSLGDQTVGEWDPEEAGDAGC